MPKDSHVENLPLKIHSKTFGEAVLRIKRRPIPKGKKDGWLIRYVKRSSDPERYYEVCMEQKSKKLEHGAKLILRKINKL